MRLTALLSALTLFMHLGAQEWALPVISVANVRDTTRHGAEMTTQVLMGTPLKITQRMDCGWSAVITPEGYTGYVIDNSLTFMDDCSMERWRKSPRLAVISPAEIKAYSRHDINSEPLTDLVPGDIIGDMRIRKRGFVKICLPDGRCGWVRKDCVAPLETLNRCDVAEKVLESAVSCMGTPYMWGGLSVKGMDCSGLTKLAYLSAGIIIPRDAPQQALVGRPVAMDSLAKSDLVFFGNPETGRINHVAVYEGDGYCIESAGRVKRSLVENAGHIMAARRYAGNENSDGIITITSHPWYFDTESVEERTID
ncbi:MAG: C40 family peptidase [Muribaculum sp.]